VQESVWDYPRPPRVEPASRRVRVELGGATIADSVGTVRVLETSHPPVYYVPPGDVADGALRPSGGSSTFCEWKGRATYYDVVGGDGAAAERAAWTYLDASPGFEAIRGWVAFYPARMDACFVDDERVEAQAGDFYGGWITSEIVGPFKGSPGTRGW
jgi:uncharacterized protein (DUF427 family)